MVLPRIHGLADSLQETGTIFRLVYAQADHQIDPLSDPND